MRKILFLFLFVNNLFSSNEIVLDTDNIGITQNYEESIEFYVKDKKKNRNNKSYIGLNVGYDYSIGSTNVFFKENQNYNTTEQKINNKTFGYYGSLFYKINQEFRIGLIISKKEREYKNNTYSNRKLEEQGIYVNYMFSKIKYKNFMPFFHLGYNKTIDEDFYKTTDINKDLTGVGIDIGVGIDYYLSKYFYINTLYTYEKINWEVPDENILQKELIDNFNSFRFGINYLF